MNLLHLRYFFEVARAQSFTEAARTLRVSQPAISKMVRLLEGELGQPLIVRSRGGLRLTEEGEAVFRGASRIFAEARAIEDTLRASRRELTGPWCVGASDNISIHLLPRPLGRFKSRHPALEVSLFSGTSRQIKDEILQERCALGLFYTPPAATEPLQSRKVLESEFWIVIAKRNSWITARNASIENLRKKRVPRIESRHADYSAGFPAHFHSAQLGLKDPPWIQVNQHEAKKRIVQEGFGYALLTRHSVEREVEQGELIRIPSERRLAAPIYAVWRKNRPLDRASEKFLGEFIAHAPVKAGS